MANVPSVFIKSLSEFMRVLGAKALDIDRLSELLYTAEADLGVENDDFEQFQQVFQTFVSHCSRVFIHLRMGGTDAGYVAEMTVLSTNLFTTYQIGLMSLNRSLDAATREESASEFHKEIDRIGNDVNKEFLRLIENGYKSSAQLELNETCKRMKNRCKV